MESDEAIYLPSGRRVIEFLPLLNTERLQQLAD